MRLFANNAGKVAAIKGKSMPAVISIDGFAPRAIIIQQVGVSQKCKFQINTALSNAIYIYSFGDDIGAIQISGMGFTKSCTGNRDGGKELFEYYARNRIARHRAPVRITFAGTAFSGLLHGMTIGANVEATILYRWELSFLSLPDLNGIAAGSLSRGAM